MADTADSDTVRSFVAIELDVHLCTALRELQARLRQAPLARIGRWVSPEGIHLTLKFLGNVPTSRLPELEKSLQRACTRVASFPVAVTGLGCFPSFQRPRVLWVGVEEPTGSLQHLYSAVERELERAGFRPEGRPFTPHLTLARIREQATNRERAEFGAWVKEQGVDRVGAMEVREVCLMRSVLRPDGAVYSRLVAVPLQPEEVESG